MSNRLSYNGIAQSPYALIVYRFAYFVNRTQAKKAEFVFALIEIGN